MDQPPPMPRWVKLLGAAVLVLVAAFIGLHLAGLAPSHHGSDDHRARHGHTP